MRSHCGFCLSSFSCFFHKSQVTGFSSRQFLERIAKKLFMNGLVSAEVAKGEDLSAVIIKEKKRPSANVPCLGIGYVQKITCREDIDVMEDLENGKPP